MESGMNALLAEEDPSASTIAFGIGVVAVCCGFLVLLIGTYRILRGFYRQKHWTRTDAVIKGYNTYGDEVTTTYVVITYHDDAGTKHECELKIDWFKCPPEGTPTSICYDPRKPDRAELPRPELWWFQAMFF